MADREARLSSIVHPLVLGEIRDRVTNTLDGSQVVTRDLARYYRHLQDHLRQIELHEQEAVLIWMGVKAARDQPFSTLIDAVVSEHHQQCGRQGPTAVRWDRLLARLQALTSTERLALINACERVSARYERDGWGDIPTTLRAVGFRLI